VTIGEPTQAHEQTLTLIDTHCHLDDASFAGDLADVMEASRGAGVVAWINVGYASDRWDASIELSGRIPGMAHMLGVHPSHAQEWSDSIAECLRHRLVASGARAVGEIGLDFYRDNAPLAIQRRALIDQLAIARDLDLPAVVHLRDAEDELLKILAGEQSLPRLVFHSFDGSQRLTRAVLELDAIVGVGGLATRQKSATLRDQLRHIPLDRIVLETDSPYLVPARQKDRRNTPAHVRTVAAFLASHFGRPIEEIADQTTRNAEHCFGSLLPS
jgi:TatD DNase family protein